MCACNCSGTPPSFSYIVTLHLMLIVGYKSSGNLYPMHLYWNVKFSVSFKSRPALASGQHALSFFCLASWYVCVCVPFRPLITSGMLWCDLNPIYCS